MSRLNSKGQTYESWCDLLDGDQQRVIERRDLQKKRDQVRATTLRLDKEGDVPERQLRAALS